MARHALKEETNVVKYPRRTQKKLATRLRIIKETAQLLSNMDCSSLTLAIVAEAADIHVTTLFTHFKNKQELFTALTEPRIKLLRKLIDENMGRVLFFDFYRDLWSSFIDELQAGNENSVNDVLLWREQVELVPAWLVYEKCQSAYFAEYLEHDYPLTKVQARLMAGMLVTANLMTFDEWLAEPDETDLRSMVSENLSQAEFILRKSFLSEPPELTS